MGNTLLLRATDRPGRRDESTARRTVWRTNSTPQGCAYTKAILGPHRHKLLGVKCVPGDPLVFSSNARATKLKSAYDLSANKPCPWLSRNSCFLGGVPHGPHDM